MDTDKILSPREIFYSQLLADYKSMLCKVMQNYQQEKFNVGDPVILNKELLRKFCFSADLARKVIDGGAVEPYTMMHILDVLENTLTLYEPSLQTEGRLALIKRKNYFYKKYVVSVDLSQPIKQRGAKKREG